MTMKDGNECRLDRRRLGRSHPTRARYEVALIQMRNSRAGSRELRTGKYSTPAVLRHAIRTDSFRAGRGMRIHPTRTKPTCALVGWQSSVSESAAFLNAPRSRHGDGASLAGGQRLLTLLIRKATARSLAVDNACNLNCWKRCGLCGMGPWRRNE